MNYLIQRGKIRSQVINVPEGLPELLSDVTREVLRCQPTTECLCQFIIDYLHSVIVTREKARSIRIFGAKFSPLNLLKILHFILVVAKMIVDRALRTVDEVIADMCVCDIDKVKADKMSVAMEECFKRFLAKRRCEKGKDIELVKFNEFDMLDELMQKCKFSDDELKISRPMVEAAYQKFVDAYMTAQQEAEGTEALYQYFRDRELKRIAEQAREEAAIKIQSSFRGFLVRRSLFSPKDVDKPVEVSSELSETVLEQEAAARKIQQYFRAHMSNVRKQTESAIEMAKDVCKPESLISLTAHSPGSPDIKVEIPDEVHPKEAHLTYQDTELQEISQTETQTEQDIQIDSTTIKSVEIKQEVIVDDEEAQAHEESHIIVDGENAQDENAEE